MTGVSPINHVFSNFPPSRASIVQLCSCASRQSDDARRARGCVRVAHGEGPARRPLATLANPREGEDPHDPRVSSPEADTMAQVERGDELGTMDRAVVRSRGGPLHVRTPLIISKPMSEVLGRDVYLKLDALQPSGSFKLRGIGYTCQKAIAEGANALVSSSGGNAGLATAYAGQRLGAPTTVVVPETTPEFIRDRLRSLGATVVVHGSQWSEAHAHAVALNDDVGGKLVHPYDDRHLDRPHAVVHEIKTDLEAVYGRATPPAAIVTCVGGGGLLAGILQGLDEVGWASRCPVIAAETIGADCLATSVDAGSLRTLPAITSVAKSLGAASPSPRVLEMALKRAGGRDGRGLVRPWRTTDEFAIRACVAMADDHRVLVEPACGAALSAVYGGPNGRCEALDGLEGDGPVVVEVCGGAIVDRGTLAAYAEQFGIE